MKLASGGNLKAALTALRTGDAVELAAGGTYQGVSVFGLRKPLRIVGNGASLNGMFKAERCGPLDLSDLHFLPSQEAVALFVVQCDGLTARRLLLEEHEVTGLLTANTSHVLLEDCESNGHRQQHGYYLSQSGDDLKLLRCKGKGNGRAAVQVNAVQPSTHANDPHRDSLSHDVSIQDGVFAGNQAQGGAALNLAGVIGGQIVGNQILDHLGRAGIALFDDGAGAHYACRGILIDGNTFGFATSAHPEACISAMNGCRDIRIGALNGFAMGVPDVLHDAKSEVVRM